MNYLPRPLKKLKDTSSSSVPLKPSTSTERIGRSLTSPSRLGDIAELYAITWLWDEGFEVYHNAGCTGCVDIVAIKDNEVYLFDVKMDSNPKARSQEQKDMGVRYLLFNPTTRALRMMQHKE